MRGFNGLSRRSFLRASTLGAATALSGCATRGTSCLVGGGATEKSRVAVTTGGDRADNVYRGLKAFENEIKRAIGRRRVVIKPNNVVIDSQLVCTHAGCLEGILEFLASIGQKEVVIAESAASGPTFEGYDNFGYTPVAGKYKTELVDLDKQGFELLYCVDQQKMHPHPCRMSSLLLDRDNFIISAAVMKTHDRVVATLSLKNIVVGAPIKDEGYRWGGGAKGSKTDKHLTHGNGFTGVNYNLFALASRLRPDLAVIDGFVGVEGNGPIHGEPVDHRVAVAGLDWLAADRTAVELMGIDFARIGYLNYCYNAGMGEADINKIEVVGSDLKDHIRQYRLHENIDKQMEWMS